MIEERRGECSQHLVHLYQGRAKFSGEERQTLRKARSSFLDQCCVSGLLRPFFLFLQYTYAGEISRSRVKNTTQCKKATASSSQLNSSLITQRHAHPIRYSYMRLFFQKSDFTPPACISVFAGGSAPSSNFISGSPFSIARWYAGLSPMSFRYLTILG